MSWIEITLGVILAISAVAIILVVLLQESQQQNPGALTSGNSGTFFSKNQSLSIESFLAKWTKIIAISFFMLVVALNAVSIISGREEMQERKKRREEMTKMAEERQKKAIESSEKKPENEKDSGSTEQKSEPQNKLE